MKSLTASRIKHSMAVVFLLLASFESPADTYASVVTYGPSPLQPSSLFINPFPLYYSVCLIGEPCVAPDGSWTEQQLPTLEVGQQTSISTSSPSFAFYLGNSLNGKFGVSLTPTFQIPVYDYSVDELTANIVNRTSILSTTNAGVSSFEASSGIDYYILLKGSVHGGQTYQLQVSQVPLPGAFWLFGSVLYVFSALMKRKQVQQ